MAIHRAHISRFLSGTVALTLSVFFIANHIHKRSLINQTSQEAGRTFQAAKELVALGVSENDELIALMHERKQLLEQRAEAIKQKRVVLYGNENDGDEQKDLEQLIAVNKKMLHSYVRDLQDYRKLGVPQKNHIVQFAQKKIARLTLVLAELERQLISVQDGVAHSAEHIQRLKKLVATNQKSVENYREEMKYYRHNGLKLNDPKVAFLKHQLTDQMRSMNQLERILG